MKATFLKRLSGLVVLVLITILIALPVLAEDEGSVQPPSAENITESADEKPSATAAPKIEVSASTEVNTSDTKPSVQETPNPDTASGGENVNHENQNNSVTETAKAEESTPEPDHGSSIKKDYHDVKYIDQDDSLIEKTQIEDGKLLSKPIDPPAPEGYRFAHWYDVSGSDSAFDFHTPITSAVILKAQYTALANEADTDSDTGNVPEEEQTEVRAEAPRVDVSISYDGDVIFEGTKVTLKAKLYNVPEGANLSFQWQSNASGVFADVKGATGQTHVFYADAGNSDCLWRVNVTG